MKKLMKLIIDNDFKISFTDKSGNWKGGHKRGGYIILTKNGRSAEYNTISGAISHFENKI